MKYQPQQPASPTMGKSRNFGTTQGPAPRPNFGNLAIGRRQPAMGSGMMPPQITTEGVRTGISEVNPPRPTGISETIPPTGISENIPPQRPPEMGGPNVAPVAPTMGGGIMNPPVAPSIDAQTVGPQGGGVMNPPVAPTMGGGVMQPPVAPTLQLARMLQGQGAARPPMDGRNIPRDGRNTPLLGLRRDIRRAFR